MWNDNYIPSRDECEKRAVREGYMRERGAAFWSHWERYRWHSKFTIEQNWASFMKNAQPHERLPTPPTAEQAAERHLIPPEVWYQQHLEELARQEQARLEREGPLIPMPEHMRRKKPLSRR